MYLLICIKHNMASLLIYLFSQQNHLESHRHCDASLCTMWPNRFMIKITGEEMLWALMPWCGETLCFEVFNFFHQLTNFLLPQVCWDQRFAPLKCFVKHNIQSCIFFFMLCFFDQIMRRFLRKVNYIHN